MIELHATIESQQSFNAMIARIEAMSRPDAEDVRPIQEAVRAGFAINFAREAGDDAPWAQLSLWTIQERRQLGFPGDHPILFRTGRYHDSFVDEEHPLHVSEFMAHGGVWMVEEGSRDQRADELEFGRWNMPPRPVTILGESGEARLDVVVEMLFGEWFDND